MRHAALLFALACATPAFAQLNSAWTVTVNGQRVNVNDDGTFRVANIAAPDLYGPGGPGTRPDFLSDQWLRATAVGTIDGVTYYGISNCFKISQGETLTIDRMRFSTTPPRTVESIMANVGSPTLTSLGATTQTLVNGTFSDGTSGPVVSAPESCMNFATSNSRIVSVDETGLITAVGPGRAIITVLSEGAVSATRVFVAPDDPLTTVVGFVQAEDGTPVAGATVTIISQAAQGVTNQEGAFSIPSVATINGTISVRAEGDVGGSTMRGNVTGLIPVPEGFTDAGIIKLTDRPTNCCTIHSTTGCDDAACEAAICGSFPICCIAPWDLFPTCVARAQELCPELCGTRGVGGDVQNASLLVIESEADGGEFLESPKGFVDGSSSDQVCEQDDSVHEESGPYSQSTSSTIKRSNSGGNFSLQGG